MDGCIKYTFYNTIHSTCCALYLFARYIIIINELTLRTTNCSAIFNFQWKVILLLIGSGGFIIFPFIFMVTMTSVFIFFFLLNFSSTSNVYCIFYFWILLQKKSSSNNNINANKRYRLEKGNHFNFKLEHHMPI